MTKPQERMAVFVFGVFFVIVMLVIAMWVPSPTPTQYETFKVVLALAVAGVAAFIPGFLQVTVPKVVRAGGALAVFAVIYMNTPAQVVATPARHSKITWHAHGQVLDGPEGQTIPVAAADIRVAEDENAHAISNQDGSFDVDVHAWPDGQVLFRVKPPGRPEFTKLIRAGTGFVQLQDKTR